MKDSISITMRWESHLSVNDRYSISYRGRPRLRPEVVAWQEELAWRAKVQAARITWDDITLIVDIEMQFPDDGRHRDADNYLKAIFDALEMGLGIDDTRFVPFIRSVRTVPPLQAGFTIRVFPATFGGRGLYGTIEQGDRTIITLDEKLPTDWNGTRVCVNLGVVHQEEEKEAQL